VERKARPVRDVLDAQGYETAERVKESNPCIQLEVRGFVMVSKAFMAFFDVLAIEIRYRTSRCQRAMPFDYSSFFRPRNLSASRINSRSTVVVVNGFISTWMSGLLQINLCLQKKRA